MIVYEDEASFRQTPTLYRTWARRGQQPQIPTRGERNTQKILGAVSVPSGDFVWRHQTDCFNAQTYLSFLDEDVFPHYYRRRHRVYLIQDNATYHKKPEVLKFFARSPSAREVRLLEPSWREGKFTCTIQAPPDAILSSEGSTDLRSWSPAGRILATEPPVLEVSETSALRFYRVIVK